MLVLTRRVNERLIIGNDIIVAIGGIKGNQVKLCVKAPDDVDIHREEIWLKIQNGEGIDD